MMRELPASWSDMDVDPTLRLLVERAARIASIPVSAWLERAIRRACPEYFVLAAPIAPPAPAFVEPPRPMAPHPTVPPPLMPQIPPAPAPSGAGAALAELMARARKRRRLFRRCRVRSRRLLVKFRSAVRCRLRRYSKPRVRPNRRRISPRCNRRRSIAPAIRNAAPLRSQPKSRIGVRTKSGRRTPVRRGRRSARIWRADHTCRLTRMPGSMRASRSNCAIQSVRGARSGRC